MDQTGQIGLHVEHEYVLFIKRVQLEYDSNLFSLNPWLVYKRISRVGFVSYVRFCHPYMIVTLKV